MKIVLFLLVATSAAAFAQKPSQTNTNLPAPAAAPQPPPPVFTAPGAVAAPAAVATPGLYNYDQKQYGGARPYLVPPDQAQAIIEKFKAALARAGGKDRFVIYLNRELVDEKSGLKLTSRTEKTLSAKTQSTGGNASAPGTLTINAGGNVKVATGGGGTTSTERVAGENRYRLVEPSTPTLADRQTVRDVERLFGRPLRAGGAKLVDQSVATALLDPKPGESRATVERAVLSGKADYALEILLTSKSVTVAEVSGDRTYSVPDLQATVVRLADGQIVGQVTGHEVIGRGGSASYAARNYDVRDIAEAAALLLMEDVAGN
ncbi:MAG: hypothetical protein HY301_09750 [Verrucomicrobia bacterium]|nr:hypothetical protein [Verrucomicrobiota bacterium]